MKKISTLLFILMSFATLINAQKFAIGITTISVTNKGAVDTVHFGNKVVLNIKFQNYGAFPVVSGNYQPDSFPGGKYKFNYHVSPDGNKNKVDTTITLLLPGLAYKAYGTIQDTIYINKNYFKFYNSDTNNIIIIWPTGGSIAGTKDSIDSTQHNNYQFHLYPHNSGINIPQDQSSFKVFPNPAKDVVNIEMKESGNGTISLFDLTGKILITKPFAANAGENLRLPLNEGSAIPDGMYLVGIQTSSGNQVSKLMICR